MRDRIGLRIGLRIGAAVSLALLSYMIWTINQLHPLMYRGSFLLVSGLTCAMAFCTLNDPDFVFSRLLHHRVIQWIGSRSYSLSLVHWFVFTLMRLHDVNALAHRGYLAAGLLAIGVLSEVSYRVLERWIKTQFNHMTGTSRAFTMGAYTFVAAIIAGAVFLQSAQAPDKSDAVQAATGTPVPVTQAMAESAALPSADNVDHAQWATVDGAVDAGEKIAGGEHIYAIGDAVLLGASAYLSKSIPSIHINAKVGRQASQGLKIAGELHGTSNDTNTMLLHLGTNGDITESQIKDALRALANWKSVLIINVHANRRWTTSNNDMIERMTHDFTNVHLINWHAISSDRPDYFVKDGIHLTQAGILALTAHIKVATGGATIVASGMATPGVSNASAQALRLALKTQEAEVEDFAPAPKTSAASTAENDTKLALSAMPGTSASGAPVIEPPEPPEPPASAAALLLQPAQSQ
ncbi:MAG: acyltransferase [Massilia sp.]|nr:acyltransferase [Massilia sp.]